MNFKLLTLISAFSFLPLFGMDNEFEPNGCACKIYYFKKRAELIASKESNFNSDAEKNSPKNRKKILKANSENCESDRPKLFVETRKGM